MKIKEPMYIRLQPALKDWLYEKAQEDERTVTATLERILREAQERDERGKELTHANA